MKITTSKIIIGISIMTITIVMMIINADISANVKAFALILTVPFSIATTLLLLAEEAEKELNEMMINEIAAQPREAVTRDIKRIDINDFNILFVPEENFDIDTENNIENYINEWVDLLDLRMICTAPVVKTCDIDVQVNEIRESLSKMARDADKRIAELCKIGGDKK